MSNILLLSLQQVIASVETDEDFAPASLQFFEADGVTPIELTEIEFTARVGMFPPLTSSGDGIVVTGNSLSFFVRREGLAHGPLSVHASCERWNLYARCFRQFDADRGPTGGVFGFDFFERRFRQRFVQSFWGGAPRRESRSALSKA